jgi:hypothetical protein
MLFQIGVININKFDLKNMPILMRKMKAAGVKDEDVAAHIAEMKAKKPKRKMQETENYIQLEEYEYYDCWTKESKMFKHIMFKGDKYIPLESKEVAGRDCFWNKRLGAILVFFSCENNWYPYRSIDKICQFSSQKVNPSFHIIEHFYIDIDAYMSGILDIEFEDNSQDAGDTNIVFNMRKWIQNNCPDKAMTMYEIDEVIAEHKAACFPSKYQMIVKWN